MNRQAKRYATIMACPSGRLTAGMRFAIAHPNPYGLCIPAKRCPKLRAKE